MVFKYWAENRGKKKQRETGLHMIKSVIRWARSLRMRRGWRLNNSEIAAIRHRWILTAHLWLIFSSLSHTQKSSLAARGRNNPEDVHHGYLTRYQTARGHFLTQRHVQDCFPNFSQSVRRKEMIKEVCPQEMLQGE